MDEPEAGLWAGRAPYVRVGRGPKTAVALMGGDALFRPLDAARGARRANRLARLLPPGYQLVLVGYPADPPPGYDLDAIVADLAAGLREEVGPATVLGASFGGFVALRLAAAHPDLVERLVLLVSAHRFSPEGRLRIDRQVAELEAGRLVDLVRGAAVQFRRPWFDLPARLRVALAGRRMVADFNDPAGVARLYRSLFSADLDRNRDLAPRVLAPTLIVGGDRDQYFDEAAFGETAALIPRARFARFPGETHMLPIERSAAVAAEIAAFLAAGPGAAD